MMREMVRHNMFQQTIRVCILLNTLSLSLEHHDQPELLTKASQTIRDRVRVSQSEVFQVLEISNLLFSCIFSIEMMLKLTAFGVFEYFDDGFNVFDSLVVCFG